MLQAVEHMDDGTPIHLTVSINDEKVNHPNLKELTRQRGKDATKQTVDAVFMSLVNC